MLPYIHFPKRFAPLPRYFGIRHESSTTPAPGRIYSQRQLFEVKKTMMRANNPEKYALASDFLAHRADRPKDYKPDVSADRIISPSPQEKRLLVLTGMYKRESDIPEFISEVRIAMMKERLNFMVSIFCLATLIIAFLTTIKTMYRTMTIAVGDS
ncbi:hypothetical protein LOAG_10332 [Loa loa]|uniref:Uncharacterized protein n=1 Tax=Loa loa TaxID=7209 RepID=A0A1I7VGZ4_LOALO|nr:hypothetical protein LOAG_10332 [Loa loa]EFO18164.1 hypothetical protein LOAG_10332 [Loa loa]